MGEAKEKEAPAEAKELVGKDLLYQKVADYIEGKTGKRFGRTNGQTVVNLVVGELMALAVQDGAVRLNQGFGSFQLRTYGAGERRLPNGDMVKFDERQKLRYEQGVMVEYLIEHGGDIAKAEAAFASDRDWETRSLD